MPIEGTPFLGLSFAKLTLEAAAEQVRTMLAADRFSYVVTPNVDHRVRLDTLAGTARGDELWSAYVAADLCVCDSRVLGRLAKLFGKRLAVVAGSDLTARLLETVDANTPIAIVGSDADAVAALKARFGLTDVAHHAPPMGMLDNPSAMAGTMNFMRNAGPRLFFLAVGSPQSEILCYRAALNGDCQGVALCTGASVDFLTGRQTRAPKWVQCVGVEWLYRLLAEPSRMWRRYLVEGPKIFRIALRDAKSKMPRS
jgi:N-acetylglucosaminyldiphosphoundecaprenol N-acetyl-beta-D-mannosaminyltransferase